MQLYRRLNIDIESALKIDLWKYLLEDSSSVEYRSLWVEKTDQIGPGGIWSIPPYVIFSEQWTQMIRNRFDTEPSIAQIFMRWPYYQHPQAHRDTYDNGNIIHGGAINWCIGIDSADHVWYRDPGPDIEPILQKRSDTDIDLSYPIDSLEELGRVHVGNVPTLVNTEVLHSIEMRDLPRLCCSVRFNGIISWQDHLDCFEGAFV